jgi:hypothetical protein
MHHSKLLQGEYQISFNRRRWLQQWILAVNVVRHSVLNIGNSSAILNRWDGWRAPASGCDSPVKLVEFMLFCGLSSSVHQPSVGADFADGWNTISRRPSAKFPA